MVCYYCRECKHCYKQDYLCFCMHKDNYLSLIDDYSYTTDAGYDCLLNVAQEDYIPLSLKEKLDKENSIKTDEKVM